MTTLMGLLKEMPDVEMITTEFNAEGDKLPFGLVEPTRNGEVVWICDYDESQQIVSVFHDSKTKDKDSGYLHGMDEAIKYRDTLRNEGWVPLTPANIQLRSPTAPKGMENKPLTRDEKRRLQREIRKELKS